MSAPRFALILSLALPGVLLAHSARGLFAPEHTQRGFPIHAVESAPEGARETLSTMQANFGMLPNIAGVMAESPALLNAYFAGQQALAKGSSLTPAENNLVQLAIAVENQCQYCTAAHSMAAESAYGSTKDELEALRSGRPLANKKSEALRRFAKTVYAQHGRISDTDMQAFLDAGYSHAQALDVVACIALKVMTNFANQVSLNPVDEAFAPMAKGLSFAEERQTREAAAAK
jgi:uncharacterized peroxidase-related enzyme